MAKKTKGRISNKNASLNRLQSISDNLIDGVLYRTHITRKGRIQLDYAGIQWEAITGVSIEDSMLSMENVLRNVHTDDVVKYKNALDGLEGLDNRIIEFRYLRQGHMVWLKLQSKELLIDGELYREGLMTDITDNKTLKAKLVEALDKARESDRLKSMFLANMSHEIRTPMNAIIGFLEFLTTEEDLPAEQRKEYMRIVSDNAKQLLKLIGDILDISKIEAGKISIFSRQTDLNALLSDIRMSFEASHGTQLKDKGVELILDETQASPTGLFNIDGARVHQILDNLIGNAIKFTDHGYVKFGYNEDGHILKFFVEDTGIGISQEKIDLLGKPFQQLHDPQMSAHYGGTGIGLAISLNLIKLMGGSIHIDSEIGKGTRFEFTVALTENPKKNDNDPGIDLSGRTSIIAGDSTAES